MSAPQFLEFAVSLSLQVAVVIAATHLLGKLSGNERVRCRLWTCCFVALLMLVLTGLTVPHLRLVAPRSVFATQTGTAVLNFQHYLGAALFALWIGGVIVLLTMIVARWWRVSRYIRKCVGLDALDSRSQALQSLLPAEHRGQATVLASSALAAPFCWQFHRPWIVLPDFVLEFDDVRQQFIIRHELEHLRLGHPLQLFLQRLVEVVFWMHPLTWWASRQAALAREFACDDAAVHGTSETANYLRTLMEILLRMQPDDDVARTALTFGGRTSIVTRRARRLVHRAHARPPSEKRRLPQSLAVACLLFLALASSFIWLPVNLEASPLNTWSPWPNWSARVLHDCGIEARFETSSPGRQDIPVRNRVRWHGVVATRLCDANIRWSPRGQSRDRAD